jgi:hypothetical protein
VNGGIVEHSGTPVIGHAGHQLAGLTGRIHPERTVVGRLVCLTCEAIIRPLRLCGEMTKAGKPCRVPIREDLGYESCWSHGQGAGRTSTPRRMRRVG